MYIVSMLFYMSHDKKKTCLWGFRAGQTQTHCMAIEASWKLEFGMKERICTFGHAP